MREGVRSGRRRLLSRSDEPPASEDFLFHLSRGSELLVQNRVVEAKEELERALAFQPRDVQSQDLLAGVYFRLGVYPTAIGIWQSLLEEFPDDPTLHVNTGLALFKTGQPNDAREHLVRALELDPDHERGWGYLGLVEWRLGKLDLAREAFLRGGQVTMARRMEEQSSAGSVAAPRHREPPQDLPAGIEAAQVSAMRDAATAAAAELAEDGRLRLERPRPARSPSGKWTLVETGVDPVPVGAASRPSQVPPPPTVDHVAARWAIELPERTPLALGPDGELLVASPGGVHGRLEGLRAVRGRLATEPVTRRFRGRSSDELLGGPEDPIQRWAGPVAAVLRPSAGRRFVALDVDESLLYVREELVQAFDDRVGFESGRLPLGGAPAELLSFHGRGVVVLRLTSSPTGLEVRAGEEVRVDPAALVGWTGRLFPSEAATPSPPHASLAFKGQGILLVT
ncbi:MAG: tetratricopeptide repeat protein [Sandaracinaceae bacterium]|nr:tetratricopeptide repeat protein [Sandaracinaceae bacterium]